MFIVSVTPVMTSTSVHHHTLGRLLHALLHLAIWRALWHAITATVQVAFAHHPTATTIVLVVLGLLLLRRLVR